MSSENPRTARLRKFTYDTCGESRTILVSDGDLIVLERPNSRRPLGKWVVLVDRNGARIESLGGLE